MKTRVDGSEVYAIRPRDREHSLIRQMEGIMLRQRRRIEVLVVSSCISWLIAGIAVACLIGQIWGAASS